MQFNSTKRTKWYTKILYDAGKLFIFYCIYKDINTITSKDEKTITIRIEGKCIYEKKYV